MTVWHSFSLPLNSNMFIGGELDTESDSEAEHADSDVYLFFSLLFNFLGFMILVFIYLSFRIDEAVGMLLFLLLIATDKPIDRPHDDRVRELQQDCGSGSELYVDRDCL